MYFQRNYTIKIKIQLPLTNQTCEIVSFFPIHTIWFNFQNVVVIFIFLVEQHFLCCSSRTDTFLFCNYQYYFFV